MYTSISTLVASVLILSGSSLAAPAPQAAANSSSSTAICSSVFPTPNNKAASTVSVAAPTSTSAPAPVQTPSTSSNGLTLFQQLMLASSAVERLKLLPNDEDFIYDFQTTTEGIVTGAGGKTVRADHAAFPALVGSGGSLTIGFLGPCGFNTPHVHPRASELNLVVQGHLISESFNENGARFINHNLSQWQMTVFPQGAIHTEFNPDCTESIFVAAFPNEDPGVGQIAQEYFGLSKEIVQGSVGGDVTIEGADVDAFRTKIPANVAQGVDSCLIKCGIKKRTLSTMINDVMQGRDLASK
ncbi:hypothetical protein G7Y89_g11211 [Cudoniella acicularis]|uniref:Cupin type-1 domain-containing protein n=1 Tax=Cudoniella acicularis TaxID=354080 RepID=A0A8H4RBA6_9HELO|nr:hypothetical protein G7Y89_g11211 [Cudoniella acicularis]